MAVDISKINCQQYILFAVGDPHDIAVWLSGYYNGIRHNTVLDTQQFREHAKKVMDYCESNPKSFVMDAVEQVLGVKR
jgi:acid stress chaperone HdeB